MTIRKPSFGPGQVFPVDAGEDVVLLRPHRTVRHPLAPHPVIISPDERSLHGQPRILCHLRDGFIVSAYDLRGREVTHWQAAPP